MVLFNIFYCEVELNSKFWIVCIWFDKKVIFVFCNVVYSFEVILKYVEISNFFFIYLFRNNFFYLNFVYYSFSLFEIELMDY